MIRSAIGLDSSLHSLSLFSDCESETVYCESELLLCESHQSAHSSESQQSLFCSEADVPASAIPPPVLSNAKVLAFCSVTNRTAASRKTRDQGKQEKTRDFLCI